MISVGRFEDRNLVGVCHLDVIDVDDVLTVGDELDGNVADTIVLKEGKSWSRIYLEDEGGRFEDLWKQSAGDQHSEAKVEGNIAKDRLALMPHLWRLKGSRYLILVTTRNHDVLLMGRKETPASILVSRRRTGDGANMERERNEYDLQAWINRRLPVPFYQGVVPPPPAPPGECAAASLSINSSAIGTVASGGSRNIPVVDIDTLDPVGTWNAEEQRHEVDMGSGAECPSLCEKMDEAFGEGGDPVLTMTLELTGTGPLPITGTTNGRPHYSNGDWGTFGNYAEAYWTGTAWYVTDGNSVWGSSDDVATPDLITNWTGGDAPYPVLTMAGGGLDASAIVDCWDTEQRAAVQALVCDTPAPVTVQLRDSAANNIGAPDVYAPGTTTTKTAPDGTVTLNSSAFDTVKSNGALNIPVKNTAGVAVGSKVSGEWIVPAALHDSISFEFEPFRNRIRLRIRAANAGTYIATSNDGSSGTITFSKNGSSFAAFSNPTVLAANDIIEVQRTTLSAEGWVEITQ